MIVETGYGFEWAVGSTYDLSGTWPISEEGQKSFTIDLINMLNKHDKVNGLFWWYPEYTLNNIVFKNGSEDWSKNFTAGYWNAALFHYKTGKALAALYEMKDFVGTSGMLDIRTTTTDNRYYTLDGRKLTDKPTTRGIYIYNGKKIIIP